MADNPWKTVDRKVVYKSRFLAMKEDKVIRPDGSDGVYNVLSKGRSNVIVPVTDDGKFYLVGQWRYPIGRYSFEFPGGQQKEGEGILDAGKREFGEETGFIAQTWKYLGWLDLLSGNSDDIFDVLVAEGIKKADGCQILTDEDGVDNVMIASIHQIFEMSGVENRITNAHTLACFALYLRDPEVRKKILGMA